MEKYINRIDGLIPKSNASIKTQIMAFEKISRMKFDFDSVAVYMVQKKHTLLKKFDTYFKKVHKAIRNEALKHPSYKANLIQVGVNNFTSSSKFCNPRYYKLYKYYPFSFDKAHQAYQKTLDEYDPNKTKDNVARNWLGFWSLIKTEKGKVTKCFLGDTADRETFYSYITSSYIINKK